MGAEFVTLAERYTGGEAPSMFQARMTAVARRFAAGPLGFAVLTWPPGCARPAWVIIVITFMLGGVAAIATGVYLAVRRIRSDLVVLFRLVIGARTTKRRGGRNRPELA